MRGWKQFDVYAKGMEGIQERTIGGGIVTLLSYLCVTFLLMSEISQWWRVEVVHRMQVDTSPQEFPIDVDVDVTFLHEKCNNIGLDVSDSKGEKGVLLNSNIEEIPTPNGEGCRLVGSMQIQKVAGDISFAHEGSLNLFTFFDFLNFNSSHVVSHLRFGPMIPSMENPLIDVHKTVLENVAMYKYFITIVPTKYRFLNGKVIQTFQYSVTEHRTKPSNEGHLSFPGVVFSYEFSPIAVEYVESKPSFLQFLTGTSAIVGGVFAVARMIDSAIYSVVSKKID